MHVHFAELWKRPEVNFIKVNFDASFTNNSKKSVDWGSCKKWRWTNYGCLYVPFVERESAFVVEAWACEATVRFAKEMGFTKVHVEGDSLTTIKKLQAKHEDKSISCPIITDILRIAKGFEKITFRLVRRTTDTTTNTLAALGRSFKTPRFWVE